MQKKRILFVNNSSKLGIGTSVSLLLLLKYLGKEFDCAVASDGHSQQLPDALDKINVQHFALPDRLVFYLPSLVNLIQRDKYDLIYANGSNERSRGAFWASKLTRRPLIWHIRESLKIKKYAGTIRFAERVIANSNDTAERLIKYAGVTNPIIIANGVEIQSKAYFNENIQKKMATRFGLNSDWFRVVNIGRICPDKNQADVIRVASRVITSFPQTYFLIIGTPEAEYLKYLKELVRQFELDKHVLFFDYTSDIAEVLQDSDLMLHVSKKESQGRVLLEAMAVGLPVVAYKVGGVGDVVLDGQTGFLQPYGDLEGVTQIICRLLLDSKERIHIGEAGYQRVKDNFLAENTARSVREVIKRVLVNR